MEVSLIDIEALRAVQRELDRLRRELESVRPTLSALSGIPDLSASLAVVQSTLDDLPRSIARAIAEVLSLQHRAILSDVRQTLRELTDTAVLGTPGQGHR
ncbi:MAG: hypothetical protein ACRDQ6_20350 [Pseudonocardiaceae bacterium]